MISKSIFIEKLYRYDLKEEPCSVAVPFAKGELLPSDVSSLCVLDEEKQSLPCSFKVTAVWPDNSIKYLHVRFLADLPANKNLCFSLTQWVNKENRVKNGRHCPDVKTDRDVIKVNTGKIEFAVSNHSESIFSYVKTVQRLYSSKQLEGPVLKHAGKKQSLRIDSWKIIESGNVCVVLEGHGTYGDTYGIHVRIHAYAGKEYIELAFRLFNDTDEVFIPDSWNFYVKRASDGSISNEIDLKSGEKPDSTGCGDVNESAGNMTDLFFKTTGISELARIESEIRESGSAKVRTLTGRSNYKTRFEISGDGADLSQVITADSLVQEANEHFAEVLYGTFMADFCDDKGGVCGTIFQAQQNFPKAIKAAGNGLCLFLIPEGREKVCFASGMAREQRILLHFHEKETSIEELDNRSLIYQMPVAAFIDPMEFKKAEVFPNIVTPMELANDEVELAIINKADHHGRAYGMMNWGDFPDANYTAQGRGGGRLVWSNNEYDYPHAMFMMYARTGERRFFDYGKTAALHWMDVDVCHYSKDPLYPGGQWEHTACHNGGDFSVTGVKGVMVCSHEWVEGLLDLWHFTGDERAYETAVGIGENVLRLLDTPMYQKPGEANARETGWALRTLTALYVETSDEKWVVKCNWIVEQFKLWRDKYGAWLAPYTDNTVIRVGFMISVAVGSLMRYYRVFPDESLRKMILEAVDDLVENARNAYGLFYYKDLPSLRRNGNNALLLESMYIGYELTGDVKYLQAGLKTFYNNIAEKASYDSGKRIEEDAVLVGRISPKGFAQSFLPLIQFYNGAVSEGLIRKDQQFR